jgi:hypothetical protein
MTTTTTKTVHITPTDATGDDVRVFVRTVMPPGTKRETLRQLQGYVMDTNIPCDEAHYGAYYRYMDLTDKKLMLGGFMSDDNGYTVALSNNGRTFKITRKNRVLFRKVSDKEKRYNLFQRLQST